jgi:hypothetical protein
MTYSVIFAAPLVIAAILTAVRFVGCTQDFDAFEPHGPGDEGGEKGSTQKADANLAGKGTLSVDIAFVEHGAEDSPRIFSAGDHSYQIPWWCNAVDLFLLGGGGGGSADLAGGKGGDGGQWEFATLWRGPGPVPDDLAVDAVIPSDTATISITVGAGGPPGGANAAPPGAGGDTVAVVTGVWQDKAVGGAGGVSPDPTGRGPLDPGRPLPGMDTAGGDQTTPGQPGLEPGGGGAGGGFLGAGPGADGAAWARAYQH